MNLINKYFDAVCIVKPSIHEDIRGNLSERYNPQLKECLGVESLNFCLEYISTSNLGVLRGLHYQVNVEQGKLISVVNGRVFDVVVDLRKESKTFGQYKSVVLDSTSKYMIWIPPGFAHGFLAMSDLAVMLYSCTGDYCPENERCIRWDDSSVNIDWPQKSGLIISEKDKLGSQFEKSEYFEN
jgi:dTDP-4-dehydrorhamnose 3,5-epimerase